MMSEVWKSSGSFGSWGEGSHLGVFEGLTFFDGRGEALRVGQAHRVLVVFDRDHDERVIEILRALEARGNLWRVAVVGERKGRVTIVTNTHGAFGGFDVLDLPDRFATSDGDLFELEAFAGLTYEACLQLVADPHVSRTERLLRDFCDLFGVAR